MEIQDAAQTTGHHSAAAQKRFKKSEMPDNWYWNTVQDNFDKTREERIGKVGETAGKVLNYLATPVDWKRAKDKVDRQNMESLAEQLRLSHQGKDKAHLSMELMEAASRSIEEREAQNAEENFKQILIGTGSTEAEAKEEIRKIHEAREQKLAGMSELQREALKAREVANATTSCHSVVRDGKEPLDNLLKIAKASKDERAVQILNETRTTLKSELQDEQKYKVLMACYSALEDDPGSPKGLLSHLAGNLWSEAERWDDRSVRTVSAKGSLDILLDTAGRTREKEAEQLITETKAHLEHLPADQRYELVAACFGAIMDGTYGHENRSGEVPALKPEEAPSERIENRDAQPDLPPLDTSSEQNLKDSFRESAFQMAEAKGGPSAEELERHRQKALKDYEKHQKSKEFWNKLGL